MCENVLRRFNVTVSQQTISNALDGQSFIVKKVENMPDGMNTLTNKLKEKEFVEEVLKHTGDGKTLVYVDESNVNLFLRRSIGRAKKGLRRVVRLQNSKGSNVHMIAGISQREFHHFKRMRGSFRHGDANEWLRGLLRELQSDGHANQTLVVVSDNVPCHSVCFLASLTSIMFKSSILVCCSFMIFLLASKTLTIYF